MHNQPREPQLMRIVKQNQFKNLGELHKEWTEAGVKASRALHTDVSRNLATVFVRGVLPNKDISIVGYNVYRADRSNRGGGVVVFIKNKYIMNVLSS